MERPDFTTPTHHRTQILFQPCRIVEIMRRIWSVSPSKVSTQTWRWLTSEPLF
jgi:hypothetical protein